MENCQYFYYATIALLVLPSVPFNRIAAIVLVVWLCGFLGTDIRLAALAFGMVFCFAFSRGPAHILVASWYIPLVMVAGLDKLNMINYNDISTAKTFYWIDYWVAFWRNVIVPFGNDWGRVRATLNGGWRGYRDYDVPPPDLWLRPIYIQIMERFKLLVNRNKSGIFGR